MLKDYTSSEMITSIDTFKSIDGQRVQKLILKSGLRLGVVLELQDGSAFHPAHLSPDIAESVADALVAHARSERRIQESFEQRSEPPRKTIR